MTENQTMENQAEASSGSADVPEIKVPAFDQPEAVAADAGPEAGVAPTALNARGRDAFFEMFRGLIAAPNAVLAMRGGAPLATLNIAPEDAAARQASDTLYEICEETPALRFLIDPQNKTLQRVFILGAFFVPLISTATAELKSRKAPPSSSQEPASPAAGETSGYEDKGVEQLTAVVPDEPEKDAA